MTTYEMVRCKKCSELVIDDDGNWICGEYDEDIHDVSDEDCPCEQDW